MSVLLEHLAMCRRRSVPTYSSRCTPSGIIHRFRSVAFIILLYDSLYPFHSLYPPLVPASCTRLLYPPLVPASCISRICSGLGVDSPTLYALLRFIRCTRLLYLSHVPASCTRLLYVSLAFAQASVTHRRCTPSCVSFVVPLGPGCCCAVPPGPPG